MGLYNYYVKCSMKKRKMQFEYSVKAGPMLEKSKFKIKSNQVQCSIKFDSRYGKEIVLKFQCRIILGST